MGFLAKQKLKMKNEKKNAREICDFRGA